MSEHTALRRIRSMRVAAAVAMLALALVGERAAAEDAPSGTVKIDQYQVAFIGSGNLGGGTLEFQGKEYEFSIGGLGIGGIGVSKIEATGEVFYLEDVTHFPGAYGQARAGLVVADKGTGGLVLKNAKGVYIRLSAKRAGIALSLGADAVYIQMK